jgi:hypothetical protein
VSTERSREMGLTMELADFVGFGLEAVLLVRMVTHRDAENVEAAMEGAVAAGHASQLNGNAEHPSGLAAVQAVLEVVLWRVALDAVDDTAHGRREISDELHRRREDDDRRRAGEAVVHEAGRLAIVAAQRNVEGLHLGVDGDAKERRRVGLALPDPLVGVGESSSALAVACEEAPHVAPRVYVPSGR